VRKAAKIAVVGGAVSVAVAGVTLAYAVGQQGSAGHDTTSTRAGAAQPVNTSPPSPHEVRATAQAFLTAWQSGNTAKAAALTDHVTQAGAQLVSFKSGLHVTALTLTGKKPTGFQVPFSVRTQLDYAGQNSTWAYDSSLTVVRGSSGGAVVKWTPSVLYPKLAPGQSVAAVPTGAPPVKAVDRDGQELTAVRYPSLAGILGRLQARYGAKMHGEPGAEIRVRNADGSAGPVIKMLSQGRPGKPLPTTIDANLQADVRCDEKEYAPSLIVCGFARLDEASVEAVAIVGDSHAAHYRSALRHVAEQRAWRVYSMTHASCPLQKAKRRLVELC
jgi:hypothetical protein